MKWNIINKTGNQIRWYALLNSWTTIFLPFYALHQIQANYASHFLSSIKIHEVLIENFEVIKLGAIDIDLFETDMTKEHWK